MRVAILGIGGLGRTLAMELRADPRVSSLLLVDKHEERARILASIAGRMPIEARGLDVENEDALVRAIRGCDLVVNAVLPRYNLAIMRACLGARAHYIDVAAAGPSVPGGKLGILEQLDLDSAFKAVGRTALLSMGMDPGISNVMAKDASSHLDHVDSIRIRAGNVVNLPGLRSFPLYSREAFLEDILVRPTVWVDGRLEVREPLSEEEDFAFPAPVGTLRTFLVSHEEVKTLPRFLGKPVGRVDYKYALDPSLLQALVALHRLGLLAEDRLTPIAGRMVPFRQVLLAALPEPSSLHTPLEGCEALCVEAEGTREGARLVRRGDLVLAHREASRRRSTTAANYLTAAGTAIGVLLLAEGSVPGPGVVTAESLDPARVLQEWHARNLPMAWSERPAAS